MTKLLIFLSVIVSNLVSGGVIRLKELGKVWNDVSYKTKEYTNYTADLNASSFTITGFSSGGFQTANLLAMFNENIDGAGIHSGSGPCATTGFSCQDKTIANVSYSTKGLKNKPIYVYSGVADDVVPNQFVRTTADWFEKQGANITKHYIDDFMHIFPNSLPVSKYNFQYSCAIKNHSLHNCGYNLAKGSLGHIFGTIKEREIEFQDKGTLAVIDQTQFNKNNSRMADYGFLYIPDNCKGKKCRFHMDFHGCLGSAVLLNDTYMRMLGLLEYAASNDLIMLFPQNNDTNTTPFPFCWASSVQNNANDTQIQSIGAMIEGIVGRNLLTQGAHMSYQEKVSILERLMTATYDIPRKLRSLF